jgi:hypothetical protein
MDYGTAAMLLDTLVVRKSLQGFEKCNMPTVLKYFFCILFSLSSCCTAKIAQLAKGGLDLTYILFP